MVSKWLGLDGRELKTRTERWDLLSFSLIRSHEGSCMSNGVCLQAGLILRGHEESLHWKVSRDADIYIYARQN